MPHFDAYEDLVGRWRWRLVSEDDRTVATSGESYETHWHALRAAENVRGAGRRGRDLGRALGRASMTRSARSSSASVRLGRIGEPEPELSFRDAGRRPPGGRTPRPRRLVSWAQSEFSLAGSRPPPTPRMTRKATTRFLSRPRCSPASRCSARSPAAAAAAKKRPPSSNRACRRARRRAKAHAYKGIAAAPPKAAPELTLDNSLGEPVDLAQLKGKAVLVTFIYTHCPDVCPLIVSHLKTAQAQLGRQGAGPARSSPSPPTRGATRPRPSPNSSPNTG